MIWQIIRKELLVNLLSLRFLIGLVVVVSMMGPVGYVLVEDYAARQQTYLSDVQRHKTQLEQTKVYSKIEVVVDIPPSPLSVFSRGVKDRPTSITVSPYLILSLIGEAGVRASIDLGGTSTRPYNPLLLVFSSIDLAFVISIILSLFAILLVFDSLSGEREQGTLRLILTCPVKRGDLLLGKFLGALLTILVPLTLGFLELMLLWSLSPHISLDASSWVGVGLVYFASLIFLSGFLALGLFVSLFAKEASSGFMYLLLVWIVVAIVIPEGGGYLADYFRPQDSREKAIRETEQPMDEFYKVYRSLRYQQKTPWYNANMNPVGAESIMGLTKEEVQDRTEFNKNVFPLKFRLAEQRDRIFESYAVPLKGWSRIRDGITRASLCVSYRNIAQAIAATDLGSYEIALGRARIYRDALMTYLQPKVGTPEWVTRALEYPDVQPTDQNRGYWQELIGREGERSVEKILSWDRVAPLDLGTMPQPQIEFATLAERLEQMIVDMLLLAGGTALFLALSGWQIQRYRVH